MELNIYGKINCDNLLYNFNISNVEEEERERENCTLLEKLPSVISVDGNETGIYESQRGDTAICSRLFRDS